MGTPWAVAVTRPNYERQAEDHLRRQGFECYLPKFRQRVFIGGRSCWRQQILFPRYIFVGLVDIWHSILRTFGVTSMIMSGQRPAIVPEKIITDLRAKDVKGFIRLPALKVGQKVQISDGPFRGRIGIYQGMTSSQREAVLLSAMGCRVELQQGNLIAV